jgi:hypothetical protein
MFILGRDADIDYEVFQHSLTLAASRLQVRDRFLFNFENTHVATMLRLSMRQAVTLGTMSIKNWKSHWASWIMRNAMSCSAPDPVDKVYSLFTFFRHMGFMVPSPDYRLSVNEVYRDITAEILMQENSLELLTAITSLTTTLHSAPSWVPDFSQGYTPRLAMNGNFCATLGSKCPGRAVQLASERPGDEKYLVTAGSEIDEIKECSQLFTWPEDTSGKVRDGPFVNLKSHYVETVQAFQDWYALSTYASQYPTSDTFYEFWKTLLYQDLGLHDETAFAKWLVLILSTTPWFRAEFGPDFDLEEMLQPAREDAELRAEFFDNPELQHLTEIEEWKILCAAKTHPDVRGIHHQIWMMSLNCTFFITESGYMGTAPTSIREGDKIVLMPGASQPMVLHRKSIENDTFTVVCAAYVHGMMDGEVWLAHASRMKDIVLE